jgi:hypothetical protein
MPPRFSYWTILAGGLPTSFRAAEREDLLPTLRRLQERHPDAEMKWFQRGKLWESPEAARAATEKSIAHRGRDWRPGGEHRDPREAFKRKKHERNVARRKERFAKKQGGPASQDERPVGAKGVRRDRPRTDRPRTDRPRTDRPRAERPPTDRAQRERLRTDRPRSDRPHARRPPPPDDRKGGRRR